MSQPLNFQFHLNILGNIRIFSKQRFFNNNSVKSFNLLGHTRKVHQHLLDDDDADGLDEHDEGEVLHEAGHCRVDAVLVEVCVVDDGQG